MLAASAQAGHFGCAASASRIPAAHLCWRTVQANTGSSKPLGSLKTLEESNMNDVPTNEGFASVTGVRVWYRSVGDTDGIPLLLIHGGPGAGSDYLKPLEALADERPVIRYDQLDSGNSDHTDDTGLWTVDRYVNELSQLRAALDLAPVHLLGHSWGTMLAVADALAHSADVVSAILAGPWFSGPRYMEDVGKLRKTLPEEVRQVLDEHEAAGTTDSGEYLEAVGEFYRLHFSRAEWFLDIVMESMTSGEGVAPVYEFMWGPNEFTGSGVLKDYDLTPRLSEITVPSLLTCGRYDMCTPETAAWYQSLIPGSELAVFEQSAHMPHLNETEHYLQTVRSFLHSAEQPM